jgi:hypothetical protein
MKSVILKIKFYGFKLLCIITVMEEVMRPRRVIEN